MNKYKTKTIVEIEHSESDDEYIKVFRADNGCIGMYIIKSKTDVVLDSLEIDPDMAPALIRAIQSVADSINNNKE